MSTTAMVAIGAAVIGVPLLLAASFYYFTALLVATGCDQHFVDDLRDRRRFGNSLMATGTAFSLVALVALGATLV